MLAIVATIATVEVTGTCVLTFVELETTLELARLTADTINLATHHILVTNAKALEPEQPITLILKLITNNN